MNIKFVILDVDGTLTDGSVYYTSSGDEIKAFNIKDGLAMVYAQKIGINFVIITGRKSAIVDRRISELGIKEIYQGIQDKKAFLVNYMEERKIKKEELAYIGDDLNDLSCMKMSGFVGCPADACDEVRQLAEFISEKKGGCGAVREIIEYIMKREGVWNQFVSEFDKRCMAENTSIR